MADRPKPSAADAVAMIRTAVPLLGTECVPAAHAGTRILAEDAFADRDVPSFRASAMDGFACRTSDLAGGRALAMRAGGEAGRWPPPLGPGQAAAISTGAPVPDGADCVIVREDARIVADRLTGRMVRAGANVRERGEDISAGSRIAAAGAWLGPDAVAALVAGGSDAIEVRRWPRIAILATGTELAAGSAAAGIRDSNGPMIAAQLRLLGLPACERTTVDDDAAAMDRALDRLQDHDLLISTGGVSVGEHDHVRGALERAGARIVFHGIAMRPGKPLLFALLPDGRPFFGLPGNPVAALVGFRFFVFAAIRQLLGLASEDGIVIETGQLGRPNTTLYLRGCRHLHADGRWTIDTDLDQRSHILSSLAAADCWLRIADEDGGFSRRVFEKLPSFASC